MINTRLTTTPSLPPSLPVCPSRTSPCVRSKCSRACGHRAHMLKHMCAWSPFSWGRFERTHGDVLDGRTGFFSVSHTTPHHKTQHNTTQHNMTHHRTPQQHDHNTTRRQRERKKTETEREEKTEEKQTKQDEERRRKRGR